MKRLIVAAVAAACCGCVKTEKSPSIDKAWTDHGMYVYTKTVEIDGHKYIVIKGNYSGNIIHSAACHCNSK